METTDKVLDELYGTLVDVNWLDIVAWGGWVGVNAFPVEGEKAVSCRTIGWLTAIGDDSIVVSATKALEDYNQHMTIPLGVVKSIKPL